MYIYIYIYILNDAFNTFILVLEIFIYIGVEMFIYISVGNIYLYWKGKEMLYLTTHSTHYLRLYSVRHMVKDHSDYMGYFRLAARVLLYASSHRQDNTNHGLCFNSCGHWLERYLYWCISLIYIGVGNIHLYRVLLYLSSHRQDNTYHSQSWSTGWEES